MRIRLGVIGLGQMAQRAYLPVLSSLETVELVAVMSRRAEVVERIRAQYRLPAGATDLADLARLKLDAAVVLTPSPTHFEIIKRLLEAGLDVLVEKPATTSSRETAILASWPSSVGGS